MGKAKAPAGMQFAKDPKRPGKYKLVPKAAAKRKKKPTSYVQGEINRQIQQDLGLTNFTDNATADIAKLMQQQTTAAANVAGQYAPVTTFDNPTLDANAKATVAKDVALTNNIAKDQAGSLAGLLAKSSGAGSELLGNMRAAGRGQHQEYARYMQGLRPGLEQQRRQELMQERLQQAQMDLARDQFGLQVVQAKADNEFREGQAAAEAASAPGATSLYGLASDDPRVGAIKAEIDGWRSIPDAKRTYASLLNRIKQGGAVPVSQAALIAATTVEPRLIKSVGARRFLAILRNQGANTRVQNNLLKRFFNVTPAKLDKKPGATPLPPGGIETISSGFTPDPDRPAVAPSSGAPRPTVVYPATATRPPMAPR